MPLPKVQSAKATKMVDTVSSLRAKTIRVPAAQPTITLSKDSGVAAGSGFDVAAGASVTVWLEEGESLWGIGASGEPTYEII
jgi:hypothetical protein